MCKDTASSDMFIPSLTFSGVPWNVVNVFLVLLDLQVPDLPLLMQLDHGLLVMASFYRCYLID